jgi:hypothetical protein
VRRSARAGSPTAARSGSYPRGARDGSTIATRISRRALLRSAKGIVAHRAKCDQNLSFERPGRSVPPVNGAVAVVVLAIFAGEFPQEMASLGEA